MKKVMLVFVLLLLVVVAAIAQTDTVAVVKHVLDPSTIPAAGSPWSDWIVWVLGAAAVLWEILLRFIPTAKDWTVVNKIASILDWVVSLFNGVGNKATTKSGAKGKFTNTKVSL